MPSPRLLTQAVTAPPTAARNVSTKNEWSLHRVDWSGPVGRILVACLQNLVKLLLLRAVAPYTSTPQYNYVVLKD